MINHEHYTYSVRWSEEDGEYVGLCTEFPSLSYLDKKQTNAFKGIVALVKDSVDDLITCHEYLPDPILN